MCHGGLVLVLGCVACTYVHIYMHICKSLCCNSWLRVAANIRARLQYWFCIGWYRLGFFAGWYRLCFFARVALYSAAAGVQSALALALLLVLLLSFRCFPRVCLPSAFGRRLAGVLALSLSLSLSISLSFFLVLYYLSYPVL